VSDAAEPAAGRRANKRAAVFRTIGEVAEDLDLPAHVLRFWESKFPQLKPLKRGGGRRYYRPEDIALLSRIRQCLYQDGYTIRGVQKLLAEGNGGVHSADSAPSLFPLDAMPEPTALSTAKPARGRRGAGAEPPDTAPHLSAAARAMLQEAAQELIAARQMLDTLLARNKA
jgi:DNA-binding transcriptional MerR regulator